jgi:hypothetical protein
MLTQTEIAAKIRKLLALADGAGTEAEAANAAARAAALMAQYQIEQADVDALVQDAENPMLHVDVESSGRVMGWRKRLASGIAYACGCSVITVRGNLTRLRLFGRKSDVETGTYMYAALVNEIERLGKRNASGRGAGYANSYKFGVADAIDDRLRAQRDSTIAQARADGANLAALVKVESSSTLAHEYAETQLGKIGNGRPSAVSSNGGYGAGQRDGRDVKLGGGAALGKGQRAIGTGTK